MRLRSRSVSRSIAKEGVADADISRTRKLGRRGCAQDINSAIAKLASACGGSVVRLAGNLDRYGDASKLDGSGLTDAGGDLIADSILGIVASALSKSPLASFDPLPPPDLAAARTLADYGLNFWRNCVGTGPTPRRLLRTNISKESMEALCDREVRASFAGCSRISTCRSRGRMNIPDRATRIRVLGLEFPHRAAGLLVQQGRRAQQQPDRRNRCYVEAAWLKGE